MKKRSLTKRRENAVRVANARRKSGRRKRRKKSTANIKILMPGRRRRRRKARVQNAGRRRRSRSYSRKSRKMSPAVRAMLESLKGRRTRRRRRNPESNLERTLEKLVELRKAAELDEITSSPRAKARLQDEIELLEEKIPLSLQGRGDIEALLETRRDTLTRRKREEAQIGRAKSSFAARKARGALALASPPALVGPVTRSGKYDVGLGSKSYVRDGSELLKLPKETLREALRILEDEIDIPDIGIDSESRQLRSGAKKARRRLQAAIQGRLVNPDYDDESREDNPRRGRRRRRHRFGAEQFGGRRRFRRRRFRRRRNPEDLVLQMLSGNMSVGVLAGAAAGGAAGYVLAGGAAMLAGDKLASAMSLAPTSTSARAMRFGSTLLLGGAFATLASMLMPSTRGSMFAGVGARALRELISEAVPKSTTTTSFLRNSVGLSGLGGFGGADLAAYNYYQPVMNGYQYNAPVMNGYQYNAPMNGLPSGGYQMRGLPSPGYQMSGLPNAGYQMNGLPNAGFVAR